MRNEERHIVEPLDAGKNRLARIAVFVCSLLGGFAGFAFARWLSGNPWSGGPHGPGFFFLLFQVASIAAGEAFGAIAVLGLKKGRVTYVFFLCSTLACGVLLGLIAFLWHVVDTFQFTGKWPGPFGTFGWISNSSFVPFAVLVSVAMTAFVVGELLVACRLIHR